MDRVFLDISQAEYNDWLTQVRRRIHDLRGRLHDLRTKRNAAKERGEAVAELDAKLAETMANLSSSKAMLQRMRINSRQVKLCRQWQPADASEPSDLAETLSADRLDTYCAHEN